MSTSFQRVICGDGKVELTKIDEPVHLIITSPPYFLSEIGYDIVDNNIEHADSWVDYVERLSEILLVSMDLLCAGGHAFVVIDDGYTSIKTHKKNVCLPTHAYLTQDIMESGYDYKGLIIWQKIRNAHASGGSPTVAGSYPFPSEIPIITQFEYILHFRKPGKRDSVSKGTKEHSRISRQLYNTVATGVWNINGERDDRHPAVFPLEIPLRLIQLFSFCGDTVLDPFMGRGTTLLAAKQCGRNGIGIDISENYCEYARQLLSQEMLT